MEKTKEIDRYLKFQRKIRVLELAKDLGGKQACEIFNISKTTLYNWKKKVYQRWRKRTLEKEKRSNNILEQYKSRNS